MASARHISRLATRSSTAGPLGFSNFGPDRRLCLTVLFTTIKGTRTALQTAGILAKNLGAWIALVAVEVVPFHFPIDHPPVPIDFLERRYLASVMESEVEIEEVKINLYLCRDRNRCLRTILKPGCLIIMGSESPRCSVQLRKQERWLRSLGHHVILVSSGGRRHARSVLRSHLRAFFRCLLGFHQSL
jgi:hypothetical protein